MTSGSGTRHGQAFAQAPVVGAVFGVLILAAATAAVADGIDSLFSLGGLVIVFGGVTAVAFMSFQPDDVCRALDSMVAMLKGAEPSPDAELRHDLEAVVSWSRAVHENGTRGLERCLTRAGALDPLLSYGLNLVVSDYGQDDVRAMMQAAADTNHQRAWVPVEVLRAMASHAPAFGMVGTLVGMVSMLHSLTDDADAIGATLAIAFLSTLYGVVSARMIYMPAAARLEQRVEAGRLRDSLVTEGMVMLAGRKSPMCIRDRLNAFLQPQARNYFNIIDGVAVPGSVDPAPLTAARYAVPRRLLQVVKG